MLDMTFGERVALLWCAYLGVAWLGHKYVPTVFRSGRATF